MPLYIYRAVSKDGDIVKNRVEEMSKFILLRKLKKNDLQPIEVIPIRVGKLSFRKNTKKQKKNVESSNSILKTVRDREIERNINQDTFGAKLKKKLFTNVSSKIVDRDIVIFTENFYLLKKANFNNIHALTTVLETTENVSLRAVIEDILLGVEARRKYVCNNGILL